MRSSSFPDTVYRSLDRDRIRQALSETAEYLESLVEQTLALMNGGARLSDALATVRVPSHLAERPYLQPFYDEPEFIVRNIWRLYGGWWDGNPANLRPAHERTLARELADLAGGATELCARAEALLEDGSDEGFRVAGHLAEMAWLASPSDPGIQDVRRRVFHALASRAHLHDVARGLQLGRTRDVGRRPLFVTLTRLLSGQTRAITKSSAHK